MYITLIKPQVHAAGIPEKENQTSSMLTPTFTFIYSTVARSLFTLLISQRTTLCVCV